MTQPCVNPDHFEITEQGAAPQPWMQLRTVATVEAGPKSVHYDSSGGGAKNDLVYKLQTAWTNNTPMHQLVYGIVTSGGQQVALQARSRAYLEYRHGFAINGDPATVPVVSTSRFGGGADVGQGGVLAVGTGFCIHDVRMNSTSQMFMPHVTGLFPVEPGETFNARVELWFVSENWENSMIDKGDQGAESYYVDAGTRLDLFAVPTVGPPVVRATPAVVAASRKISTSSTVVVSKPTGTLPGDVMVAVIANASGNASSLTYPNDWTLLDEYDGGFGLCHLRVLTKTAGPAEPATYTFGHTGFPLSEGVAQIVSVRGVDTAVPLDHAVQHNAPSLLLGGKDTMLPSIVSYNKLMLGFSFVNQFVGQLFQTAPPGMTALTNDQGDYNALAIAAQANPPIPTGLRAFKADRYVLVGDGRVSGVVTLAGPIVPPT